MNRVCTALTLVAAFGALALGCGDPCESARDRITDRYAECEIDVGEPTEPEGNLQCSDSDSRYLDCLADCTESAKCEALSGADPLAGADFGQCRAECQ